MATLKLEIKGQPGTISLRTFATVLSSSFLVLDDLDCGISRRPNGSLSWIVKDVFIHSLGLILQPRSKLPDKDFGPDVATAFVGGLAQLEQEGTSPPFLSDDGIAGLRRLVKVIGQDGALGLATEYLQKSANVTVQASANIEQLIGVRHHAIGSIEGRLETISIHGGSKLVVYHNITHKAVTCKVPDKLLFLATDHLGRRVNASGIVHYNGKGEPIRVDVEDLRILREKDDLPTTQEVSGSEEDFTDGLTTEEFIQSIRDD